MVRAEEERRGVIRALPPGARAVLLGLTAVLVNGTVLALLLAMQSAGSSEGVLSTGRTLQFAAVLCVTTVVMGAVAAEPGRPRWGLFAVLLAVIGTVAAAALMGVASAGEPASPYYSVVDDLVLLLFTYSVLVPVPVVLGVVAVLVTSYRSASSAPAHPRRLVLIWLGCTVLLTWWSVPRSTPGESLRFVFPVIVGFRATELLLWFAVTAIPVTLLARVARSPRAVYWTVGVLLGGSAVWIANWSIIEPRSYFAVHRTGFDAIATVDRDTWIDRSRAPEGLDRNPDAPLPVRLPAHLAWLGPAEVSAHIESVGEGDDTALILYQAYYAFDGAAGYVFLGDLDGDSLAVREFLFAYLGSEVVELGGGWWWVA